MEGTMSTPQDNLEGDATRSFVGQAQRAVRLLESPNATRYFLLEEIARGAMGAVLRVHDPQLDRILALKVLLEDHVAHPEMHARFLEEARLTSQLQHPGIVPVHDQGVLSDGRPFFTMRLVQGRTLASLLQERETPQTGLPRFLAIFEQICQTLAYAHSRGVIHRDLKPSNIMVGTFGEVQVMDWGVAKHSHHTLGEPSRLPGDHVADRPPQPEQTHAGAVIGTPDYMSPQQAQGQVIDQRADVFSLGCILCEILTGRSPYRWSSDEPFVLGQHRELQPAQDRLARCGADETLIQAALGCLQEEPDKRPRDAQALACLIAEYREGVENRLREAEVQRAAAQAREEATRAKVVAERYARRLTLFLIMLLFVIGVGALGLHLWHVKWQQANQDRLNQRLANIRQLMERTQGERGDQALESWRELLVLLEQAQQASVTDWADTQSLAELQRYRSRIRQAIREHEREQQFLEELANIRVRTPSDFNKLDIDQLYLQTFSQFDIPLNQDPTTALHARFADRPQVLEAILTALDDWGSYRRLNPKLSKQWKRPFRLAQELDRDEWRRNVRLAVLSQPVLPNGPNYLDFLNAPGLLRLGSLSWQVRSGLRRQQLQDLAQSAELAKTTPASLQLLARELALEGVQKAAIELLRAALRHHPSDVWLNYELALLLQRSQPDEALRYFAAARAGRPELGHTMAHQLEKLNRHGEAAELFEDLIRLRPNNLEHQICLGNLYLSMGHLEAADRLLSGVLQKDPSQFNVQLGLSLALSENALDFPRALRLADNALKLQPDHFEALQARARALIGLNRFDEAELALRRAMLIRSNSRSLLRLYAEFLLNRDRPTEAMQILNRLLAIAPQDSQTLVLHSKLLQSIGQPELAIQSLQRALQREPAQSSLLAELAAIYLNQNQPEKAYVLLERAIRQRYPNGSVYPKWIHVLYRLNEIERGQSELTKYLPLFPQNGIVIYNLSVDVVRQGDVDTGILLLQRSLQLLPDHPESHCNLGLCYQRKGQIDLAVLHLERGHSLGSSRSDWRYPSAQWLKEAKELAALNKKLADVVQGTFVPREPKHYGALALLCQARGEDATAFLLQQKRRQLASDGRWPLNVQTTLERCESLLRAGLARSRDAVLLSDKQRQQARQEAYGLLQEGLSLMEKALKQGTPAQQRDASRWLRAYRRSAVLAQMREEQELARLPKTERQAWQQIWKQLEALP
jgi:Tfp pilus assembly protein PilF